MRRSEAEGRFGEAEPEGCASIRAEWRRDENRRAPVPTARPTAPRAERSDAKCTGPGSDRTRTQSNDCGAVRAQCGTVHFAREYRWGGGPRTLTGTTHKHHTRRRTHARTHDSCHWCAIHLPYYVLWRSTTHGARLQGRTCGCRSSGNPSPCPSHHRPFPAWPPRPQTSPCRRIQGTASDP